MLAALLLAGCQAGDKSLPNLLQMQGLVRVMPDPADAHRITVSMINNRDLGGYDFNRAADRATLIANMLTAQCGAPKVLSDRVTQTSESPIYIAKAYTLIVDCPNGASRKAE